MLTTIGYGTFAPSTGGGKAFTCIYAFLGVVVCAWALSIVVSVWKQFLAWFVEKVLRRNAEKMGKTNLLRLKALIVLTLFVLLSFLMAVWASAESEALYGDGWGIGDGYYYTIITWSTVGLGDYSLQPKGGRALLSNLLIICLGLSLFAGMFEVFSEMRDANDQDTAPSDPGESSAANVHVEIPPRL